MSFEKTESSAEFRFRVTDEKPLVAFRGPEWGEKFVPEGAVVVYVNGKLDRITVTGRKVLMTGKVGKGRGFTSYDEDDLKDGGEAPQWVKDMVEATR